MLPDRFWSKVDKDGPVPAHCPELGPCWIWIRGKNDQGYGYVWFEKRMQRSHLVAWRDENGTVPDGLDLDHLCRNRVCVRTSHLEPVTRRVNLVRGEAGQKSAAEQRSKTHCPKGHPYDERNTYVFKLKNGSSGRQCRACHRARVQKWSRKRAA